MVYQACSETVYFVPKRETLGVRIPIESLVKPGRQVLSFEVTSRVRKETRMLSSTGRGERT